MKSLDRFDEPVALLPAFPNKEELLLPSDMYGLSVSNMLRGNIKTATITGGGAKVVSESVLKLTLHSVQQVDVRDCINLRTLHLEGYYFDAGVLDQVTNLEKLIVQTHFSVDPLIDRLTSNKWVHLWYLELIFVQCLTSEHLQRLVTSCQHVKKIVIKIPAYPTRNFLTVESTAQSLNMSQSRVQIVVLGGENRHKTLAQCHVAVENQIPSETSEVLTTCSHCNQSVKKCDLQDHYTICFMWPGWSCMLSEHGCQVKDMTRAQLLQHLKSCKYNEYHCIPCNASGKMDCYERHCHHYNRLATYKQSTTMWLCANKEMGCTAVISNRADLTRHMRECTADKGEYTCKSCNEDLESRTALLTHMAEECRGERKRRLVDEEGQLKLNAIAERMGKEGPSAWVDPFHVRRPLTWSQ
jgi:hypothetical protein